MIQPMMIDLGSRILIERIAARTGKDLPVVIEMTAQRRGPSAGRNHVDAINYFEGVMERLDRTIPGGWSRSPAWSELDRPPSPDSAPRRLYLYAQARVGLAEMRRIDTAAADLATAMNVRYGLAMAPGIAMTSSEIRAGGVRAARNVLLGLIADDPDSSQAPGRYSVRARWTTTTGATTGTTIGIAGRAGGVAETDGRWPRARLYLTLLRRRSTSRRALIRTPIAAAPPTRAWEGRVPRSVAGRLVAGQADPG